MKCAICGKEMNKPVWSGEFKDVCAKCFDIRFWDLIKEQVVNGETFIINGKAYTPGSQGGFGGASFKIQILATDETLDFKGNLWSNGDVPKDRLSEFPDNARFVP